MTDAQRKMIETRVDYALEFVRPHLAVDGGNVEVIEVTDDMVLKVKWLGNCEICNMSAFTMKAGLHEAIKTHVPEIKEVIAINGIPMPS